MPLHLIRQFVRLEAASGILLFIMAILAVLFNNSSLTPFYHSFFYTPLAIKIATYQMNEPLLFWINDALMAGFFLLVGLELKREFLIGELNGISKIILPGFAAIGGMLIPALIFVAINFNKQLALKGWAIPVATDIAFALGVLSLFGKRVPLSLKLFLMALAIFDDVGAIIIITFFYSHTLSWLNLLGVLIVLVILGCLPYLIKRPGFFPYVMLGVFLWFFILHSGIHPSITGVLLALFIPLKNSASSHALLPRLEKILHPWVAFFIMPLFALANAGVSFSGVSWKILLDPVTLGIVLGLVVGKQTGVVGMVFLLIKTGWAKLPAKTNWLSLYGVSLLCGIGFTMSLFLGTLAFQNHPGIYLTEVKVGVLLGSIVSGVMGAVILSFAFSRTNKGRPSVGT